jgi:probable F420-dependent oxidoreductase
MPDGVVIPFWLDRPPGEALAVADHAERFGYRELWMGEMLHFDAFALAGAIAARTERITLTVGPLALGLRDPVAMAMGIASISHLGSRPARLAVGASSPALVSGWHGRPHGGETDRLEDALGLIRAVLAGERTDHSGDYRSHGFRSPLAPQPAHLTVAAAGKRMLKQASRCADRIVLNLVSAAKVKSVAKGVGMPVAVWVVTAVDPAPEGLAQVRRQLALYLAAPGYAHTLTEAGLGDLVAAAQAGAKTADLVEMFTREHLNAVTALGGIDQVVDRIDSYREAGAEVMLVPVTAGDPGGKRTLRALTPLTDQPTAAESRSPI